jgi:hypothetical protein
MKTGTEVEMRCDCDDSKDKTGTAIDFYTIRECFGILEPS